MQNKLDRIVKIIINSLVFLVPLFFLPFGFEAFEFNKQYLLFFLVSIAALVRLAKMVFVDKELKFRRTPLDIPILAFLIVAILSAIFSVDRYSSLVGSYGRFSDGLIGLLSLAVFYFLITNNVTKVLNLIKIFFWSLAFIILFSCLSIFGIWAKIDAIFGGILPQVMLQQTFNPAAGSMGGLAVFLSIAIVLLIGFLSNLSKVSQLSRSRSIFYWILLIASLGLLFVIGFKTAWFVLAATLALFVIFALMTRMFRENVNKLLLPIFVLIVSIVFIIANLPRVSFNSFPKEPVLSQGESWGIALKSATGSPKNIFLGSGIGTLYYDFSKFKSVGFNETNLWQLRFDRSGNNFAEMISIMGFLGILTYLAILGLFLMMSYFLVTIVKQRAEGNKKELPDIFNTQFSLFLAFIALLMSQLVYHQNTVLAFLFWLILGLNLVSYQRNFGELKYSFKEFPELGLVFGVAVMMIIVGFLGVYFFAGRFYLADSAYTKALTGSDEAGITQNLEKAVKLNPYQIQYRIILSRFCINQVLNELSRPTESQDAEKIKDMVAKAIEQSRFATEVSPNNVSAWETRGLIYREIKTLAAGASEWGIKSFEAAIALEPNNPAPHTELAKLLLVEKPEEAKKEFEKALVLKSDYSDAIIQTALLSESEGSLNEAIDKLENLINADPFDTEALFQLGRIYYNNNRVDEAILMFQRIILLYPNHSNAHYALGVAYTTKKQKDLAIAEFEKVLELNPGNQDVIDRINSLKK